MQKDVTLSVSDRLPVYPDTLPDGIVVRSSGPAGDSHPNAMGLYKKLPELPVWEHFYFTDHKLFFDGEIKKINQDYFNSLSGTRWIINSTAEYLLLSSTSTTENIPQTGWRVRKETGWKEDITVTVRELVETDDIDALNHYIGGLY